jgi:hypothetical protein
MAKGFRTNADPSRKEQVRQLTAELKNMQAAMRISQMMLQQIMQSNKNMQMDLGKAFGMVSELQYKLLAVEKIGNLDSKAIADEANALRLVDFNESSDKEDALMGFTVGEEVKEDSVIIITSVAEDPDKSIFRSRVGLKEANVPDLTKGLLGREVGAKVVLDLAGTKHTIELLGIRQPAPAPVQPVVDIAVPNQPSDEAVDAPVTTVNVAATAETATAAQ